MKAATLHIPKGWRRVRKGERYRNGDRHAHDHYGVLSWRPTTWIGVAHRGACPQWPTIRRTKAAKARRRAYRSASSPDGHLSYSAFLPFPRRS